jgi:integrase
LAGRGDIVSALAEHLEDYLRLRRALGFKLEPYRQRLLSFIAYLEAANAPAVTVELALTWARRSEAIKPITASYYLSTVRGFARYLHAIDPANEVPPSGLLAVPRRRPAPYLYSTDELTRVLELTRLLRPALRAATHKTLLGLLAATGMRIGEALALTGDNVDLVEGVLTIRHAKFDRMRLVPLHPSVTAALREYATTRDRLCPAPRVDRFFVSRTGRALRAEEVDDAFRAITARIGLCTDTVRPRVHDLRHSFAVHTLIDWQRDGADIPALLPVLSTYLGHVEPANTYWYLSAVPELMRLAAAHLEQHQASQS